MPMKDKVSQYFNSASFWELMRYGIIGLLTTAVSYGTLYILYYQRHIEGNLANILSIACAIVFAYVANKLFVFRSHQNSWRKLLQEGISFLGARLFGMLIEVVGFFVLETLLGIEAMISKILINIVVLILNYLFSKLLVFRQS